MASRLMELPSFDNIVASFSRSYSYDKTYQAIEDDSAVIIHSSGTTGVPKPIYLTHGFLGTIDKQTQVPVPDGRVSAIPNQLSHDDLFLSTTPFFHLMGIFALVMSIFNRVPFVYLPATSSPADALVEVIKAERPTVAAITPALVEAVGQSASALHILSTVRTVCISGAPLAPHIGQALSKTTNLVSILGASKLGLVLSLVPEHKADWEYLEWNPNYPTRMDSCSDNSSLYELVIERNETRDIQGIFHVFPDLKEYRTKDLFSPHPTRHNLWRYEGRLDDTIIFHNGQKINPIPMEKIIESHPLVSRALVIGDRRPHAALLVEPSEESSVSNGDKSAVTEFVHTIWPVVELANELVPPGVHIGIMRIGLSSPNKPFRTTSEGSTQRRTVLQDYEQEIERIYQHDNYWYTMFKNG
ncbi:unnamed protein product [Penicillium olsonii]|uniref:AMP-dependent synthetase/ligase domain-containing protein n=1 Tax=Penicillium olsonii TaxID=99116 RepID=A0A9W4MQB2_PENOL|nr:unnamed protein product [Penicillium olsonii]CAG8118696.1 unnamed protein product [Penicillium olsonii]